MSLMGRIHPVMRDRFRAAHFQRLLCGDELGRWSVKCRPIAAPEAPDRDGTKRPFNRRLSPCPQRHQETSWPVPSGHVVHYCGIVTLRQLAMRVPQNFPDLSIVQVPSRLDQRISKPAKTCITLMIRLPLEHQRQRRKLHG